MAQVTTDHHQSVQFGGQVARLISLVASTVNEYRERRQLRKSIRGLTAKQYRDIGLIESDIAGATSKPLSQDVVTELQIRSSQRATNW